MDNQAQRSVPAGLGLPPGAASDVVRRPSGWPTARCACCARVAATASWTSSWPRTTRRRTGCRSGPSCGPAAWPWPRAIAARPLAGRRVLELGCGLGLVSVTAALAGAEVLAVDRSPEATTFAAANAARNGVTVRTAVGAFDQPQRLLREAPWDLVLAADVLYEQRNVPVLVWLLPRLVDATGEVWLADPGRPKLDTFVAGVDATGWRREQVATDAGTVTIHRLRLGPASASPRQATQR